MREGVEREGAEGKSGVDQEFSCKHYHLRDHPFLLLMGVDLLILLLIVWVDTAFCINCN